VQGCLVLSVGFILGAAFGYDRNVDSPGIGIRGVYPINGVWKWL